MRCHADLRYGGHNQLNSIYQSDTTSSCQGHRVLGSYITRSGEIASRIRTFIIVHFCIAAKYINRFIYEIIYEINYTEIIGICMEILNYDYTPPDNEACSPYNMV